jgi:hypothetical protein
VRQRLLPGHLPLHSGGEWRELPGLDKAAKHIARHIGPHPVRHGGGKLSNELATRVVAVLRVQGSKGSKMREQRKTMREKSPKSLVSARLKRGGARSFALNVGPECQRNNHPRACAPA